MLLSINYKTGGLRRETILLLFLRATIFIESCTSTELKKQWWDIYWRIKMNKRLLLTTFLELENCQENAPSLYSQLKNIPAQKRWSCWGILEQKRAWTAWFVPCLANLLNLLPDEHRRNNPHTALLWLDGIPFPTLLSVHKDQCFKMPLLQKKKPTRMGTFRF